ncbi:MAG: GH3 auxin-responsive promoter family protein [Candidatus Omnitrophota bacterium]|nr:GH3 auxin-responsive promoter family protein [Candidatus Omnitrophota bacterium]
MNVFNYTLKWLALKAKAFEKATKDPIKAQEKILREIISRNRETEYGLRYNFSAIRSAAEYRNRVPLTDYEALRPCVERMAKGEPNILTGDKPVFFSITSGSTGQPKLVPVTKYSQSKNSDVVNLWAYYIARDHPRIVNGKILSIVSPESVGHTASGASYGAESGHAYKNLPAVIKSLYSLPYEVFEIEDYDARYYTILRIGMEHNITTIATMTPSTIILLCQRIEKVWGDVIKDIRNGTLKKNLDIPANIRKTLEKPLCPGPERANELERVAKEKKALLPKYFWPDLQLIECWKRGSMELYLREIPKYFGDVPIRDFGYFSSEMRGSIPMSDEGAGGVLAIATNFYEFIPREDIDRKEKRLLLCDQLELGREYFIVLTTPGGLYRYNIDDMIRVDGFFNKTPVIEFVQKGINVTSATGEKLYESQVVEAVKKATDRCGLSLELFVASVERVKSARYAFLVEFINDPARHKKKEFLAAIDEELCLINEEYMFNRTAQELGRPVLKVLCHGSFEKFRAKKVKEGAHDGQFKLPQLTSDPDFQKNFNIVEEISLD